MFIKKFSLLVILLVFLGQVALAQKSSQVVIGTKHQIQSKILDENRTYTVGLPTSYDKGEEVYQYWCF